MKRNAFAAFCLLVGGLAGASTLVQITTADGAGADVYVENNKANFGDAPLVVKNAARGVDDPHVTRKVYLRFDLSDFTDRLSDLENAELSLMTHTNHLGGSATPPRAYEVSVVGLTDEALDNWDENAVLWEDAPANILTNNELDATKVIALGVLNVSEVPDPDLVSFTSLALSDFIKTDTNGVVTFILRRMDSDASNNLAFHSKESGEGSSLDGIFPTLHLTIGGDVVSLSFEDAISATDLDFGLYQSPWFGRVQKDKENVFFTHLGWIWTGAATEPDSMWIWNWTMDAWVWTSSTVYPWVYEAGLGWTYVYHTPENGTYLYRNETGGWRSHNDFGWQYPLSNGELMEQLIVNIPSTPHPRILFTSEDLPVLRAKMSQGWLNELYEELKNDADLLMREGFEINYSATFGRRIHQPIAKLAFVGYMEDDPTYFRHAIDFAFYQINNYTLEEFELNNPGSAHLGLGDVLHAYGIAYDWLYPHMNIIERGRMRGFLEEAATLQWEDIKTRYDGTGKIEDSSNHNSVANGGFGMAALALGNKPEWIEQAIRQNRRYLAFSTDADGWNFEGRGYFSYGGWGAFPFSEAIANLEGPDLLQEQPKYEHVAVDFFLRQMPPYTYGYGVGATWPFINRYKDRVGLWLWLHTLSDEGDGSYGSGRDVDHLVYTLIHGDPSIEPMHPQDADLPLDKVFESGRALFRDGWDEKAAVVTYSTGWTAHTGHRMRSENSFNFYALGEEFSISPQDAQTRIASLHSFVMVDERRNSRDAGEREYGSVVEEVRTEEDYAYIRGDAKDSAAYFIDAQGWRNPDEQKVSEATRQILFARSLNGLHEPYLVIIDDLTTRADSSTFRWLLQTPADNTVELQDEGDFMVTGYQRRAKLDVDFLAPASLTNEIVTHTGFVENKGRWSEAEIAAYQQTPAAVYEGKSVRFIAILRAHEPFTSPPNYTHTIVGETGDITVTLSDGTVDVITITADNMSFQRTAP